MAIWTRKAAAARSMRRLKSLKAAIEKTAIAIAGDYSDEDQYVCNLCDDLQAALAEPIKHLEEAIAHVPETESAP